jgi:SAM-dependent methyltransferase
VYIASQLVGPSGKVVGVDMTPEQLETARGALEYHQEKMGYNNIEFFCGYLEKLDEIPELQNHPKFDVIISNCVINLCSDKQAVLKHCYNLLKEGGELYFSDVYADRRVPKLLQDDPVLWGECISGALYWNDFIHMSRNVGFADPRLVEDRLIELNSKPIQQIFSDQGYANSKFYSATYRLWKLPDLEPTCEDYGQAVVYKGTIPRYRTGWLLDKHHYFEQGKVHLVCGNTWNILKGTCLSDHFDFIGSFDRHFGRFVDCGSPGAASNSTPFDDDDDGSKKKRMSVLSSTENKKDSTSSCGSKGGSCCCK